ncbi:helix-turn-helix domain-containing protein [Salinibacter ruber]|uniref:helix-turn-helix domain-containing protein n=1 Tax=Salinibacter ruber TaxID=146919 RepID=UPI0020732CA0|nr:helix-turn-helix domain-containing protein [Salinibacter ruber]
MPEQRAFSPEEVATMLGIDRDTVASLLTGGELGSKEIGDFQRIFLSDLEDYLGEERARSLVCDIDAGQEGINSGTSRNSTFEDRAIDHDGSADGEVNIEVRSSRGDRISRYQPVVQKWKEINKDEEAIVLADLSENDVQNIRNLLYRRVGKENVMVRTAEQKDGTFKAVVRPREDDSYLRDGA